jgi:hypothetical protein
MVAVTTMVVLSQENYHVDMLRDSRDLNLLTTTPAVENTRSDGTDVAAMHRYCLARYAISGNLFWLIAHHCMGSTSRPTLGSIQYFSTSLRLAE